LITFKTTFLKCYFKTTFEGLVCVAVGFGDLTYWCASWGSLSVKLNLRVNPVFCSIFSVEECLINLLLNFYDSTRLAALIISRYLQPIRLLQVSLLSYINGYKADLYFAHRTRWVLTLSLARLT